MASILKLKGVNCRNCYKCIRYCAVKAIGFFGNEARIIGNECILCGQCFRVCPQEGQEVIGEVDLVRSFLADKIPVVASLSPSFVANYEGIGLNAMRKALCRLGFADVEEAAAGAQLVRDEYERILREEKPDVLISSACPSINLLIRKYFPDQIPKLAPVITPMKAHALDIRRRIPGAKVCYICSCVSRKAEERMEKDSADAVLTFSELSQWLKAENIELTPEPEEKTNGYRARWFPTTGGILKSMTQSEPGYTYVACDGVDSCKTTLAELEDDKIHHCFIEMSACVGSCIGGPAMESKKRSLVKDYVTICSYAGDKDYPIEPLPREQLYESFHEIGRRIRPPSEEDIREILGKMGKFGPEDEQDCAACGYDTCRDKAIAIYHGKADLTMCLPYLKARAESFSETVVKNNPNGVIVLDENLHIQQINRAAQDMMNIDEHFQVLGENIALLLDPEIFERVLRTGVPVKDLRMFLAEYKRYVEQTVVCDHENRLLVCILRDVTEAENEREKKERISRKTVEIADKVVDRQMRIVQEIASLLGETAAETKIALTKLKESITDD